MNGWLRHLCWQTSHIHVGCLTTAVLATQPQPPNTCWRHSGRPAKESQNPVGRRQQNAVEDVRLAEKKINNFNILLAWHSRGRGFDSLQLHQEECQGVTEKSVTPFSLPKRQHPPTLGIGGPDRGGTMFRTIHPD